METWRHLEHTLETMVALVNTGTPAADSEELPDVEAVRAFISDRIITEVEQPTAADLPGLYAVRSRMRAIFAAPDEATKTRLVNDALAAATIAPRLADHDGLGVHFHFFAPYASLSEHLNTDCTMALAFLIASGEANRLKTCQNPDCSRVMIDSSRNRSRNFCDRKSCGNRLHAAAHRERLRLARVDQT